MFDDVVEHGGPACIKYQQYFLPRMMSGINDKSAEIRQAAAYGWGVLGQFAGESFAQACAGKFLAVNSGSRTVQKVGFFLKESVINLVNFEMMYRSGAKARRSDQFSRIEVGRK